MSNSKHARWLISELPTLFEQEVLDEEAVSRLKSHYSPLANQKGTNPVFLLTGILGSLLIGAGIISIFAYNWDNLSRAWRTFFSIAPLLIGQGFFAYGYYKKKDSLAWAESTSGFLMLMIASSIALISQTYFVPGRLQDFLWLWMLLSIPLMYLRNSSLVTMMYLAGISSYAINASSNGDSAQYWLFLAAAIPHLYLNISNPSRRIRANLLGWTVGISLLFAMINVPEWHIESGGVIAYTLIFGLLYVLGRKFFGKEEHPWQRSFQSIGIIGTYVMAMIMAYGSFQGEDTFSEMIWGENYHTWAANLNLGICIASILGWAAMTYYHIKNKTWLNYFVVFFPVLGLAAVFLGGTDAISPAFFTVSFNLFLLAWGIFYLRKGINQERLGLVNAGMFILSSLFVMRFFDEDFSFLIKGIAFVLIGAAFLGVNMYLIRKNREN